MGIEPTWDSLHCPTPDLKSVREWALTARYSTFFQELKRATYAELDLFLSYRGRRFGAEFKFSEAPKITKSMRIALDDLKLDQLWIIYPGQDSYPVDDKISVRSVSDIRHLAKEMS